VSSYRDLAEADAFHRRRLVTAFISGVRPATLRESPRTGHCLLGGLALVVVLAAGAAASSVVTGRPEVGLDEGAVRISR
jgi:hypothetical protein